LWQLVNNPDEVGGTVTSVTKMTWEELPMLYQYLAPPTTSWLHQ